MVSLGVVVLIVVGYIGLQLLQSSSTEHPEVATKNDVPTSDLPSTDTLAANAERRNDALIDDSAKDLSKKGDRESLLDYLPNNLNEFLIGGFAVETNTGALTLHAPDRGPSFLEIPVLLPEEYQLELMVRQETTGGSFAVCVPHRGFPACFIVDAGVKERSLSGISLVEGVAYGEDFVDEKRFTDQDPHSIQIVSSADGLFVYWDGERLAKYTGAAERLSLASWLQHPNQLFPTLRADFKGRFVIEEMTVQTKGSQRLKLAVSRDKQNEGQKGTAPAEAESRANNSLLTVTPMFTGPDSVDGVELSKLPTYQALADKEGFSKAFDRAVKTLERERPYLESKQLTGHIVVGRVELEGGGDPSLIQTQSIVRKDGSFLFVTMDLNRPIGFCLHQFTPVTVELNKCSGEVVDVGTFRMGKLHPDELRSLAGRVVLEGTDDASLAKVELQINNRHLNSPMGRNSGLRREAKLEYDVDSDGAFTASGFSPTRYYGKVYAPGYMYQIIRPDFKNVDPTDLGEIKLEKQMEIQLEYISANAGTSFDSSSAQTDGLRGGELWLPKGHGFSIVQLVQEDRVLTFRSRIAKTRYKDLGPGELKDFVNVDRPTEGLERELPVVNGHVYLVYFDNNITGHILFRVSGYEQKTEQTSTGD